MVLFAGIKLCDPCLSALCVPWCQKALYKYSSFPFPFTRSCNRSPTSLDAGRPLQDRGTTELRLWTRVDHYKVVEPHDYVSGRGSTTIRSWNRSTTSLDPGRPLQGRGTARLRLWTRVDHYKVVEPLDYVSGRGSTTIRSWNRSTTTLDAGRPLQGRGTARLPLWTRVDHYKVVEPHDYVSSVIVKGRTHPVK